MLLSFRFVVSACDFMLTQWERQRLYRIGQYKLYFTYTYVNF